MSITEREIPQSRLLIRTIELLDNRPRTLTLNKIEEDTGLPVGWLASILTKQKNGNAMSPSVDRIVALYEYLSGKTLEV